MLCTLNGASAVVAAVLTPVDHMLTYPVCDQLLRQIVDIPCCT